VVLTALNMSPISCFYFFAVLLRTFQPRTEVILLEIICYLFTISIVWNVAHLFYLRSEVIGKEIAG